jgi:hypothetical protein
MTALEILEGDQLIAIFCGWDLNRFEIPVMNEDTNEVERRIGTPQDLIFHDDWNWLMLACKKWDTLEMDHKTFKSSESYEGLCDELDHLVGCYEILPVFSYLVKCVKWYNLNR